MRKRRMVVGLLGALLALAMVGGMAPAQAFSPLPILCNLQAIVNVSPGNGTGPQTWDIDMAGDCSGDLEGPYFATGDASGTSDGSGFCGGLFVQNFALTANLFLFSLKNPALSKVLTESWAAGTTIWPIATPFIISGTVDRFVGPDTTSSGLGVLFNRLRGPLGGCPGSAGSSNAGLTLTIRST